MTENTQTTVADTTSSRGAQWAGAGSLIAIAAQSLLNGGIGGIFGGGGTHTAAQAANTAVAIELAKKDAEIALLKAGQETDAKLVDVYTTLRSQDKAQDEARAALAAQVGGIDKRVTALEVSAPLREQIVLGKVGEFDEASIRESVMAGFSSSGSIPVLGGLISVDAADAERMFARISQPGAQ